MTYMINEIFYSLQGEGARAGTPNVFVRFTGCNLKCAMAEGPRSPGGFVCDTDFDSGDRMTLEEIMNTISEYPSRSVILTGGEPLLQVDEELIRKLKAEGWYVAVETNGTKYIPSDWFSWVTVSPKVSEVLLVPKFANELKYVVANECYPPLPQIVAEHLFISPATHKTEIDQESLDWCIEFVKNNPRWRLSVQQHKVWGVR